MKASAMLSEGYLKGNRRGALLSVGKKIFSRNLLINLYQMEM